MGKGQSQKRLHKHHFHALLAISAIIGLIALASPTHEAEANRPAESELTAPVKPAGPLTFTLSLPDIEESTDALASPLSTQSVRQWKEVKVKRGDNLSLIFNRLGIPVKQMFALLEADSDKRLKRLRPEQTLRFVMAGDELQGLEYQLDQTHKLIFERGDSGYSVAQDTQDIEIRYKHTNGTIENSLYVAGLQSGLNDNTIMELVGIFGWDIDFALDIRKGDSFSLIYEEHYLNGEKLRNGHIIAAEFVNQGRTYRAVRYTDPDGNSNYFSPDGHSMRKAFLRSPVDFRRISSRFTKSRWHPVLGKKRPHRGVDYAAAIGTPIKASGDGKIIFRGKKGGYGKTIILSHGGKYTTLYAHMSRYKRGLKTGSRVKQGQIIGYVGKSGLATGPHLHYEFRINGVHRNPLTVKFPNASPIKAAYKDDFLQKSGPLLAQLDLYKQIRLASNP